MHSIKESCLEALGKRRWHSGLIYITFVGTMSGSASISKIVVICQTCRKALHKAVGGADKHLNDWMLIGEVGSQWRGRISEAEHLIQICAESGLSCAKFQAFRNEHVSKLPEEVRQDEIEAQIGTVPSRGILHRSLPRRNRRWGIE